MQKRLEKKIDAFLAERRKSERGGWAAVTDKDIADLYEIVEELILAKCVKDVDGDVPIRVRFTNRRTHRNLGYVPVPYDHVELDGADDSKTFDALMYNLRIATRDMNDYFDVKRVRPIRNPPQPRPAETRG